MQNSRAIALYLLTMLCPLVACSIASADTILNGLDKGWYNEFGYHDPSSENYYAGNNRGPGCIRCSSEVRNFFVFDLSSITQPITSATLEIGRGRYDSPDLAETYELHDVTTSINLLRTGNGGLPAFVDLGTGEVYGSITIGRDETNSVIKIELSASAIAAMNLNPGQFAIGGSVTSLDNLANFEGVFEGTAYYDESALDLTLSPEPSSLFLFAVGMVGLLGPRCRYHD
jgi:hypothetical protein